MLGTPRLVQIMHLLGNIEVHLGLTLQLGNIEAYLGSTLPLGNIEVYHQLSNIEVYL